MVLIYDGIVENVAHARKEKVSLIVKTFDYIFSIWINSYLPSHVRNLLLGTV